MVFWSAEPALTAASAGPGAVHSLRQRHEGVLRELGPVPPRRGRGRGGQQAGAEGPRSTMNAFGSRSLPGSLQNAAQKKFKTAK